MIKSTCNISFYRNDLQRTKLWVEKCPVNNCSVNVEKHKVPFQKYKGKMRYLPYCPEHGIRIHKNSGFVYYNGDARDDLITAIKRNLMFYGDYYVNNFFGKGQKIESKRICYENSEDAVSFNVFTPLLGNMQSLRKLVGHIVYPKREIHDDVELYLWGRKIDLRNNVLNLYTPLKEVRKKLEPGREGLPKPPTEPDIMLIIPKKVIILIEAKFGSKNPLAEDELKQDRKRRTKRELIEDYCDKNPFDMKSIFVDYNKMPRIFHEQLFRNIVFAASMAKDAGIDEWYVANLRNQHLMNMKRAKPESRPVKKNVISMLKSSYKHQFTHLTWEDIYNICVKDEPNLANLVWYLKNKSLSCGRAFNIL